MDEELELILTRFRQSDDYTKEMLIRDLIDLVKQLALRLGDHEARITALEPP